MGTRSTTKIYYETTWEDKTSKDFLLGLYKQYDGYIEGWGTEIKEFIKSGKFVNGISNDISLDEKERVFNGVGDCVLQLVQHFKTEVGGLYAIPEKDENEEYNYIITFKEKWIENKMKLTIIFECKEDKGYKEILKIEV